MSELTFESILIQVRDALQRNEIKLWKVPYYLDTSSNDTEMMNLASNFSDTLNIRYDYCLAALNELQDHALDKLKSNEELRNEGVATLKVRVPCKRSVGGTKLLSLKVKLADNAESLITLVSQELNIPSNRIKLISGGKVLIPDRTLMEQNVKNFQQIMALEMKVDQDEAKAENEAYDRVQKIRKDAEILIKNSKNDYFKLENQNGEAIHLPEAERTALMMGLLFYEKGRAQLKKDNYNEALILFLEADNEIKNCNASIIKSIDNVALLNLDIVWCYLQLKSIMQLPDAERRLDVCEDSFKRTYGENFERVKSIKNSDMSERCLIVRLKLLKAVLNFHQNRRSEASVYLSMAEQEISELKIDDEKVLMLVEMGYSRSEAIVGLRNTCNMSIDAAINSILDKRQKVEKARSKGKKERYLGKCLQSLGFDVNPKDVTKLTDMGFTRELAAMALQKSNNDITEAINLLQNENEQLKEEMLTFIKPDQELIDKLKAFGFDETLATNILRLNINNFDAALDTLLQMQKDGDFQIPSELANIINTSFNVGASTSSNTNENSSNNKKMKLDNNLSTEDEMAIFDDLRNDLDHLDEDDEYLTFTLKKEQELLNQYKRALGL
ncbi:NEDD8 ultimate buster 1-like [Chironomus tepperi]|uniref:NEDD8 ultimate buster 1-like n=1 Tax=Chironomus tepperi TaxID=113505 RepID=UPI00391F64DC